MENSIITTCLTYHAKELNSIIGYLKLLETKNQTDSTVLFAILEELNSLKEDLHGIVQKIQDPNDKESHRLRNPAPGPNNDAIFRDFS